MRKGWALACGLGLFLVVPIMACEDDVASGISFDAGTVGVADSGTVTPPPQVLGPIVDASEEAAVDASAPPPLPACDDGNLDPGEVCDPLASCPTACPRLGCQIRALEKGGTCEATCVDVALFSACKNDDGCCPPSCDSTTDNDCSATCDNGVIEAGESCDPLATCPTACAPLGCQLRTIEGAGTCAAHCVNAGMNEVCQNNDGCCPPGCNTTNDNDCSLSCGNGTVEAGETCDPLATCPTSCAPNGCMLRKVENPGTCQAACVDDKLQTTCKNADGCCPPGCNANNDSDCVATCGNGVVEGNETCDPLASCPQSCAQVGCQLYRVDKKDTCQAACVADRIQDLCIHGDGCCPRGCNANNDNDCKAVCGNEVVEPGETCDPVEKCPTCERPRYACLDDVGSAKTCDLVCNAPVLKCGVERDGCCTYGSDGSCGEKLDPECQGEKWQWIQWPDIIDTTGKAPCVDVVIYGIEPGGWYDFTTCAPPDSNGVGDGDPDITRVIDNQKNEYDVANAACSDPNALPRLAKSECRNKDGAPVMACASPSPGGFRALAGATAFSVRVCRADDRAGGQTPLYIWYNAKSTPTKG